VTVEAVGTATRAHDVNEPNVGVSACGDATVVITNVKQTSPTPASITRTGYTISIS
jgi:hypothetical protein